MFIGHLPASYMMSKVLLRHFESAKVNPGWFLAAGLFGAMAPDTDMFYFYFVDHRQNHHHTYFTHFPLVWLVLLMVSAAWLQLGKSKAAAILAANFSLNGLFHMVLDTVVGDIWWLAPLIDQRFSFFSVPALYQPWWLNFLFHWSFALEICILTAAILLWRHAWHERRKNPKANDIFCQ